MAAALKSALQMSAEEQADPSLLRRRALLLSNVGAEHNPAVAQLQRSEASVFCGKKEADAAALSSVLRRLRRECLRLGRDVAVVRVRAELAGWALRARWVALRARWVTLRARWVTLRALAG